MLGLGLIMGGIYKLAGAALGSAGLVLAACGGGAPCPRDVAAAVEGLRPVEPRLTAGFAYVPCEPAPATSEADLLPSPRCSPPPQPSSPGYPRLAELGGRLFVPGGDEPSVETLHARGVWHLLWAETQEDAARQAVAALAEAARRAPGDPRIWSDLGAAYLVRAQVENRPEDLAEALEAAHRAVALDGDLPEARFNLALARQALFLEPAARDAWEGYLALDRSSGWAQEARARLAALDGWRAVVAGGSRQATRGFVERELLGRWAEASDGGRGEEAKEALELARAVGEALVGLGGDPMAADAVAAIDRAVRAPSSGRLAALVAGHRSYAEGLAADAAYDVAGSRRAFEEARDRLAHGGSPFAAWATFQLAVADYREAEYPRALSVLRRLEESLPPGRYPALEGRLGWIRGMCRLALGQVAGGLAAYRRALAAFGEAGEAGNVGSVHILLAEGLGELGRREEAWQHLYRALAAFGEMTEVRRRHVVLDHAGETLLAAGLPRAALDFQDALVHLQEGSPNGTDPAHAHLKRSRTLMALGRRQEALADLDEAGRHVAAVARGATRDFLEADIALSRARWIGGEDPRGLDRELTTALEFFQRGQRVFALPGLYRARADARLQAGDVVAAEADLRQGLRVVEVQLAGVVEPLGALALLRQASVLVDDLLTLLAEQPGRGSEAFELADRARGRVLLELALRSGGGPSSGPWPSASASELAAGLPADVAVVEYAVLEPRLLAWVLRRDGLRSFSLEISRASLKQQVEALRSELTGTAPRGAVTTLHRALLAPLASALEGVETLILVPDKELHGLPFAALRDGGSGRFLIQDRALAVAPSAAFHGRLMGSPPIAGGEPLVLGNDAFPGLPRLARAEAEAAEVAALYGVVPRLGERATRSALLDQAGRAPVIHVAGHALSHPQRPEISYLALASEGEAGGALFAREILGHSFAGTGLVVLSACSTAGGPRAGLSTGLPLAQAFLAAGVRAVVASLWEVDDAATAHLVTEFHRRLLQGLPPHQALREAQVEMLTSDEGAWSSPSRWAGFEVLGGFG